MSTAYFQDFRTKVLVYEDPVQLTDGLFTSMSAVVQFDPRCGDSFINAFARMQNMGLIKLKTVSVKKKRDWIKL